MIKTFKADMLTINIYENREKMGEFAAQDIKNCIKNILSKKDECNIIFAAAPSQNEVLETLANSNDLDFSKINAFHMDEYIGLEDDAPQGFGNFLKRALFGKVNFKNVFYLKANEGDIDEECERYTQLLKQYPTDIVCMGIGENGHIAFNDPPVADFDDPYFVKKVQLDELCRAQQVNDGCFENISLVPTHALTLTIPVLTAPEHIFCVVPNTAKANAVKNTVTGDISTACPASILRKHKNAVLYLDKNSAELL